MVKILAIDDQYDNLISLKAIFKDAFPDSVLYTALKGPDGIELAIERDPDVILLDIKMPDMDGYEVCQWIKQDERTQDTPVVFLTSINGDKENRIKALNVGAEAFLSKPFDQTELIAQIRAMIKIKTANRQKKNEKQRLATLVEQRTHELELTQQQTLKLLEELKMENEGRKTTEMALRQSEEAYRRVIDNIDEIIYSVTFEQGHSLNGKVGFVSKQAKKILGYAPEEFIQDPHLWFNTIHPDDKERMVELTSSILKGENIRSLTYRMKNKITGEYIWIEDHPNFIFNENRKIIGQYGIARDITERKRVENDLIIAKEKAEESDRLKSAFLANMSHEIRTPMNGILGFAELLKEPDLLREEKEEYIDIIRKSGKRMLNIINDIISISRVEAGQMQIILTETNLNDQIEYICSFFKPEAEQKKIQLFYKNPLPPNQANIKTDKEKIYAILTNLVKNAIKFTWDGFIELGCEIKKNEYIFYVKDTGEGIPEEKTGIIFERFRQGSETLSRNYEGAGLGLSISKAYVEILGGRIWVTSQPGEGSVFYFTLPCEKNPEDDITKEEALSLDAEDKNWHKNLKILIAEDDAISSKLLKENLKPYASEIIFAESGVEAVDLCMKNPDLNLILMDIQMPEMNGYDAVREIRKFNREIIIFAQTAFALQGDEEKAIAAGCNDYISKPIKTDHFRSLLKKYLN